MRIHDDDIPLIVLALRHYGDYMRATNRDERPFHELADRLMKKEPQSETKKPAAKRKA